LVRRSLVIAIHLAQAEQNSDSPFLDGGFCSCLLDLFSGPDTLRFLAMKLGVTLLSNASLRIGIFGIFRASDFTSRMIETSSFDSGPKLLKWYLLLLATFARLSEVGDLAPFVAVVPQIVHFVEFTSDTAPLDQNSRRAAEAARKLRQREASVRCAAARALAALIPSPAIRETAYACDVVSVIARSIHRFGREPIVPHLFDCVTGIVETDGVCDFFSGEPFLILIRSTLQSSLKSAKAVRHILRALEVMLPHCCAALWNADVIGEVFDVYRLRSRFELKAATGSFLVKVLTVAEPGHARAIVAGGVLDVLAEDIDAFDAALQSEFLKAVDGLGECDPNIATAMRASEVLHTALRNLGNGDAPEVAAAAEATFYRMFPEEAGHRPAPPL
jgi:hypothetical protein